MEKLYEEHHDLIEFFVVSIQEAPQACSIDLHISIPTLVEEMDNFIDEAYGVAPERLYLIGKDGTVFYHGGAGPHFFDLE